MQYLFVCLSVCLFFFVLVPPPGWLPFVECKMNVFSCYMECWRWIIFESLFALYYPENKLLGQMCLWNGNVGHVWANRPLIIKPTQTYFLGTCTCPPSVQIGFLLKERSSHIWCEYMRKVNEWFASSRIRMLCAKNSGIAREQTLQVARRKCIVIYSQWTLA